MLDLDDLAPERLRRFTRSEYEKMAATGMFDDERVELLRGVVVRMTPSGPSHADIVSRLNHILVLAVGDRAMVRPQCPLLMPDESMPEPDLAVVAHGRHHVVHPADALLVVEVAESSLNKDRRIKAGLYAEGGVAEYWIVNVRARVLEVYRDPAPSGYASVTTFRPGGIVRAVSLAGVDVSVDAVLPPADPSP